MAGSTTKERKTAMTIRQGDSAWVAHPGHSPFQQEVQQSYYAEVPAQPIDEQSQQVNQLIDMAFDTPGLRHLAVRVIAARS
jgi:hypothetical protein